MSEIEKMYENAGVKKEVISCPAEYYGYNCTRNNLGDEDCTCYGRCYPPFTAEKQIELIKWLIQKDFSDEHIIQSSFEKTYYYCSFNQENQKAFTKFEEALAYVLNYLWQSLLEEEKQQIKEILK